MDFGSMLEARWKVFGGQSQIKNQCVLGRFLEAYVNIGGAASKLRVGCEGAARGVATCVLSAAEAPKERRHHKNENGQNNEHHSKLSDTALGRWAGEFRSTNMTPEHYSGQALRHQHGFKTVGILCATR